MCEPTTIIAIAGVVMSAYSQQQQGKMAKEEADYNARIQQNDAIRDRNSATEKENDHRKQVAQLVSKQRAQAAASGVDINTGSASDLIADTEMLGEEDALRIRAGGDRAFEVGNQQASLTKLRGQNEKTAGTNRAIGTALTGAGRVSEKWYKKKSAFNSEGIV